MHLEGFNKQFWVLSSYGLAGMFNDRKPASPYLVRNICPPSVNEAH